MAMINIEGMFTVAEMTESVNKLPMMSTRMASQFTPESVRSTNVELDVQTGQIILINTSERGSVPEDIGGNGSSIQAKVIKTSHLTQSAHIRPEDIQDVRAFGTNETIRAETVINNKMQKLKNNLAMTKEHHRLGAIKGHVLDADGSTVLYDLFDIFGVNKQKQAIRLSKSSDAKNSIIDVSNVVRKIQAGMGGNPYQRIECIVGSEFYDALTTSDGIGDLFYRWQTNAMNFGDTDWRQRGFPFGGITFYEASLVIGGEVQVAANAGHAYPVGPNLGHTYYAPADWIETANTYGLEHYARIDPLDRGRGYTVEVQSNPATIFTFPEALIELSIG